MAFAGTGSGSDERTPTPARRSVWAFGAVALGMVASSAWEEASWVWLTASVPLLVGAWWSRGWACAVLLLAATCMIGGGWFSMRVHESSPDALDVVLAGAGRDPIIQVEAIALEAPRPVRAAGFLGDLAGFGAGRSWRFEARVERVGSGVGAREASGVLRVYVPGDAAERVEVGSRLRLMGVYAAPAAPANPGEFDARRYGRMTGRVGTLTVRSAPLLTPLGTPGLGGRRLWLARVRARALASLEESVGDRGGGVVELLVLGHRGELEHEVGQSFVRQGVVHVLSISGFHVGLFAWMVLVVTRLARDMGRVEYLVVALAVVAYALLVPARAPVVRASTMVVVFSLAEWRGRRYDRLSVLGWVAIALALWRPLDLFALGYQLSFGVVAALLVLTPRVRAGVTPVRLHGVRTGRAPAGLARVLRLGGGYGRDASVVSVVAWGVSAPWIAARVGVFSPVGWLTALVAAPAAGVVLALGLIAVLAGLLPEWTPFEIIGEGAGTAAGLLCESFVWIVGVLDESALTSWAAPTSSLAWAACCIAGVWWWLGWRVGAGMDGASWRDKWALGVAGALLVWFGVEWWATSRVGGAGSDVALRVDMLAVGDGTCMLVRSGREAMLWDSGGRWTGIGERTIPRAVRGLGVRRVERAVITHPNTDHYMGLIDAQRPLRIGEVIVTDRFVRAGEAGERAVRRVLDELDRRGVEVRTAAAGDRWRLGEAEVRVLHPTSDAPAGRGMLSANDTSLVVELSVETDAGVRSVLLTGDVGTPAIAGLMRREAGLAPVVVELPHHGSANAAAVEWVGRIDPAVVLQSTGWSRVDDERWDSVRGDGGAPWWVSARDGSSFALIRRDGRVESGSNVR